MTHEHVIVQRPSTAATQLILLFHGVGDNPAGMAEIGRYFARDFPQAAVISIGGPEALGPGPARQWFSVQGVTEENRSDRVAAILPAFIERVRYWQQLTGIGYASTALVGFSQGAIMSLEALSSEPKLAGRVVAFSGRFAQLPKQAFAETSVHLIHGDQDAVIAVQHSLDAEQALGALNSDVTLDVIEGLSHAIDQQAMDSALEQLHNYIPKRYWDEAISGKRGDLIAFR